MKDLLTVHAYMVSFLSCMCKLDLNTWLGEPSLSVGAYSGVAYVQFKQ